MKQKKAKAKAARRPHTAAKSAGQAIIADLTEFAEALEAGIPLESKYTIRHVEIPDPPANYSAHAIRVTRDNLGVSQSIFAHLLGVSTILVQAWEQGNRAPAAWARRLLDEVNRDPKRWRAMVKRAS